MPVVEVLRKDNENDGYRRRLAIQIAAQLPTEASEARLVLLLALDLVDRFLSVPTGV